MSHNTTLASTHAINSLPSSLRPASQCTLALVDLLSNSLVLAHIVPYLPPSSIVKLAALNSETRAILSHSPRVYRHLDLSTIKAAQFEIAQIDHGGEVWRNVQLDENVTEDDFYSGPLRGIFSKLRRNDILKDVQTLVLDGLSVTSDFVHDIINDSAYTVRILSVRDAKNLNHGKLRSALQYACRPSRPKGTPRLKGIYVFGKMDRLGVGAASTEASDSSISSDWNQRGQQALTRPLQDGGDAWWNGYGRVYPRALPDEWAQCLQACAGVIAFDAVLCNGPRHANSPIFGKPSVVGDTRPAVATISLPGCAGCGKAPEGVLHPDTSSLVEMPLLAPVPIMSSSLRAAVMPSCHTSGLIARCMDCIRERYCSGCSKWWCEACYVLPGQTAGSELEVQIIEEGLEPMSLSLDTFEEWEDAHASAKSFKAEIHRQDDNIKSFLIKQLRLGRDSRKVVGNAARTAQIASTKRKESARSVVPDTVSFTTKVLLLHTATGASLEGEAWQKEKPEKPRGHHVG